MLCSHLELGLTKITSLKIYVAKFRWQPSETFLSLSPSSFYFSYMYVLNFKQYTLITVSLTFLNSDYSSSCDFKNLGTIWIILFQWLFVLQNTSYISIFYLCQSRLFPLWRLFQYMNEDKWTSSVLKISDHNNSI